MKAKFIGDPRTPGEANNLPESMTAFGVKFERGKFADVPADAEDKFRNNSHFEVKEGGNSLRNSTSSQRQESDDGNETVDELKERIADETDVAALKRELASEDRVTAKAALEARIEALEA